MPGCHDDKTPNFTNILGLERARLEVWGPVALQISRIYEGTGLPKSTQERCAGVCELLTLTCGDSSFIFQ